MQVTLSECILLSLCHHIAIHKGCHSNTIHRMPHLAEMHTSAEAERSWDPYCRNTDRKLRAGRAWECLCMCKTDRGDEGHKEEGEAQQLQPVSPFCIIFSFVLPHRHTHTVVTAVMKSSRDKLWSCCVNTPTIFTVTATVGVWWDTGTFFDLHSNNSSWRIQTLNSVSYAVTKHPDEIKTQVENLAQQRQSVCTNH